MTNNLAIGDGAGIAFLIEDMDVANVSYNTAQRVGTFLKARNVGILNAHDNSHLP
jgi:hypothetical protein